MLLLEFSMSPLDKGESLSKYVAGSLKIIHESGVPYRINPMGTVLEGEWDDAMRVLKSCFDKMREECNRISIAIKVDYRKGKTGRLDAKIESVEKKLGIRLNK